MFKHISCLYINMVFKRLEFSNFVDEFIFQIVFLNPSLKFSLLCCCYRDAFCPFRCKACQHLVYIDLKMSLTFSSNIIGLIFIFGQCQYVVKLLQCGKCFVIYKQSLCYAKEKKSICSVSIIIIKMCFCCKFYCKSHILFHHPCVSYEICQPYSEMFEIIILLSVGGTENPGIIRALCCMCFVTCEFLYGIAVVFSVERLLMKVSLLLLFPHHSLRQFPPFSYLYVVKPVSLTCDESIFPLHQLLIQKEVLSQKVELVDVIYFSICVTFSNVMMKRDKALLLGTNSIIYNYCFENFLCFLCFAQAGMKKLSLTLNV
ncbi:LOW QUALITY PROTEIN: hypothetical protein KUF71_024475 [Frankliniella fusca]|uniref:Uncharacterized protein n=1 Tax=Frankliniella fusca TaxID=407009 RepID=A0AAE1H5F2_9NEOP|nr:LOW QUALITY PROTEIN: hypothetical protein KUF71_024475 [Frankliniella fusca]